MKPNSEQALIAHQIETAEREVKYYERMHADARRGIEIAQRMSLEMKERRIEAQVKLDRLKGVKP